MAVRVDLVMFGMIVSGVRVYFTFVQLNVGCDFVEIEYQLWYVVLRKCDSTEVVILLTISFAHMALFLPVPVF